MKEKVYLILAILLFPVNSMAHGVLGSTRTYGKVVCVKAWYSTGEPMNYDEVRVISPKMRIPFQVGRTDKNGIFCFLPDATGEWKVMVSDGLGHLLKMKIHITSPGVIKEKKSRTNTLLGSLIGILTITALFGVAYLIAKRGRT